MVPYGNLSHLMFVLCSACFYDNLFECKSRILLKRTFSGVWMKTLMRKSIFYDFAGSRVDKLSWLYGIQVL